MNERFGWKYYFYFIGCAYLVGLALNLLFVHGSLDDFWLVNILSSISIFGLRFSHDQKNLGEPASRSTILNCDYTIYTMQVSDAPRKETDDED